MDSEYSYYEGAAIALIVINAVSFMALLFVIIIYLVRWKQIASFPMRIVSLYTFRASTFASPAASRIYTSLCIHPCWSISNKLTMPQSQATASSKE